MLDFNNTRPKDAEKKEAFLKQLLPNIGSHCFINPNCGMYTAIHPMVAEEKNRGLEIFKPITISTLSPALTMKISHDNICMYKQKR